MERMKMNEKLLGLIHLVQTYRDLLIRENMLHESFGQEIPNKDWWKECWQYYIELPQEYLDELNLRKNTLDFESVVNYKLTDEMLMCEYKYLNRYEF
jgi:hypothetical protein